MTDERHVEHDAYTSKLYKENWDDAVRLLNEKDAEIARLKGELADAGRQSYQAADIVFRGYCYNVGSQDGIDSLRRAITRAEHG